MKTTTFLVAILLAITAVPVRADSRSATVKFTTLDGQCSGVIVTADGVVITAEHCGKKRSSISIDGVWREAKLVYHPPKQRVDEAAVFRLPAGLEYPHAPIAAAMPAVGEWVYSWGYPSGKLQFSEGKVLRIDRDRIICDFYTFSGNSGGALFNAAGEVVGLASTRNTLPGDKRGDRKYKPGSQWIGLSSIRKSLKQSDVATVNFPVQAERPHLRVFGYKGCPGCDSFKRDWKSGKFDRYQVEYVDVETADGAAKYRALMDALEAANGKKPQGGFPAFHVAGRAKIKVGYQARSGWTRIGSWIRETLRLPLTIPEAVFGGGGSQVSPAPAMPSPPTPAKVASKTASESPVSAPAPEQEEDDPAPWWPFALGLGGWLLKRIHDRRQAV